MEYTLRPVDYDPFDEDPTSPAEIPGFKLRQVDYDPFEEEKPELSMERVGGAIGEGVKDVARTTMHTLAGVTGHGLPEPVRTGVEAAFPALKATTLIPGAITRPVAEKFKESAASPELQTAPEYEGKSSGWIEDFARSAPQMATQIIATLGGGPLAGMGLMGLQITGSTYEQAVKQGKDPKNALAWGIANAIVQAPMEQIGIGKITKLWKPQKDIIAKLKEIGEAAGVEWLTEFLQSYPDSMATIFATNPDKTAKENLLKFKDDLWETTKQGAYEGTMTAPWALLGVGGIRRPKAPGIVEGEPGTTPPQPDEAQLSAMAKKLEVDYKNGDLLISDVIQIVNQFPKTNHPVHQAGMKIISDYEQLQSERTIDLGMEPGKEKAAGLGITLTEPEQDRLTGQMVDENMGAIMPPLAGKSARESAAVLQQGPAYLPQDMDRLGRVADLNQERAQSELMALREKAAYDAEHAQAALPWAGEELQAKMTEEEQTSRIHGLGGLAPYVFQLLDQVKGGVPGRRQQVKDYDGTERWFGLKSTYPEFMKNQYAGAEVEKAIEKGLSGYEFKDTEVRQKKIWDDVLAVTRSELNKDIEEYARLIEEDPSIIESIDDLTYKDILGGLRNEGYSTRAIQEAAERHRGPIQARAITEASRRTGIPEEEISRIISTGQIDLDQVWNEATLTDEELGGYYDSQKEGRLPRPLGEGQEPGRALPETGTGAGEVGAGGILQTPEGGGQEEVDHLASAYDKAAKLGPKFVTMLTFAERAALSNAGFAGKGNVYDLDAILEAARARGVSSEPGKPVALPEHPAPGLETVKLYRAESTKKKQPPPEWMTTQPGFKEQQEAQGRWFGTRQEADWYLENEYPDGMGRIVSVEVTPEEAESYKVANLPKDHPARKFSRRPEVEYFLPHELAEKATEVTPTLTEAIDEAAEEAEKEPTEAQIEAGNYKKGHITIHGLDISIENPKGSVREGVDKAGKPWKTEMKAHYGYIRRTEGEDGDQIDTFIGPNPEGEKVFVIDQVDPETGEFDEFKVMLGYPTEKQARVGYLANYERGWKGLDTIREYDLEEFKEWLKNPRPASEFRKVEEKPKPKEERRKDIETRKKVEEMTPDEMRASLLSDELTGLGNKRAYEEDERLPIQVFVDVDSLKWINDNISHEAGNDLLKAVGWALNPGGPGTAYRAYHISGDEFIVQAPTVDAANAYLEQALKHLDNVTFEYTLPDGTTITKKGAGISYGVSTTVELAEAELQRHKAERQAKGLRAARGETPPGVARRPPEKGKPEGEEGGLTPLDALRGALESEERGKITDENGADHWYRIGEYQGTGEYAYWKSAPGVTGEIRSRTEPTKQAAIEAALRDAEAYAKKAKGAKVEAKAKEPEDLLPIIISLQRPGQTRSPVLIRELRDKANMPYEAFDAALLELSKTGKVVLHSRDFPSELSEADRKKLVKVGDTYYVGVVPKAPEAPKVETKPAPSETKPAPSETKEPTKEERFAFAEKLLNNEDSSHVYNTLKKLGVRSKTTEKIWEDARVRKDPNRDYTEAFYLAAQKDLDRWIKQGKPAVEGKPKEEEPAADIGTPENINVVGLAKRLVDEVMTGIIRNKVQLQMKVAGWLGTTRAALQDLPGFKHKPIEEAWEYATVLWARKTIEEMRRAGKSRAEIYGVLRDKYMQQPNLATRTGTSIENQAYSTPVHLGFLAQEFVKIDSRSWVYEPTAGTGMLLTEAEPAQTKANELDDTRLEILRDQNFLTTQRDALEDDGKNNKTFDGVLANPPFGSITTRHVDGYKISKLEHVIVMNALRKMKDDGRAAFIIGGHNFDANDGEMIGNQKIFLNWLYNHYNVVANIDIPGEEYARQGSKFDVRLIVVNGRKATPAGWSPDSKDSYQTVKYVDDILGLVHEVIDNGKNLVTGRVEGVGRGAEGPGARPDLTEGRPTTVVQPPLPAEGAADTGAGVETPGALPGGRGQLPVRGGETGANAPGEAEGKGHPGRPKRGGRVAKPIPGAERIPTEQGEPSGGEGVPEPGGRVPEPGERQGVLKGPEGAELGGIPGAGDTLINDLLGAFDEEVAKQEAAKDTEALRSLQKGRGATLPEKPTAKQKAQETVDYTKKIAEGAKKINELLGDTGAISWQQIPDNDSTWKQIKQILRDMLDATLAAGKSAVEFAKLAAKQMGAKARPYFEKFIRTEPEFQAKKTEPKPEDTEYQTLYTPKSKGPIIDETLVPLRMKEAIEASLDKLEKEVGDIDKYVAEKLHYKSMSDLHNALAADQVDAVALAINNIEKGMGMVIGDQTGVGKGRVAAAVWRYARIMKGKPIFFTAKPTLFSDFYRDMKDIGSDFNPLIMASKEKEGQIVNQDGKVIRKVLSSAKRSQYYNSLQANGPISLSPFDGIVTTYSQVREPNVQQRTLARMFPGSIVILDESHKAAGPDSETGTFIRAGLQQVSGVVYLSATFAKRPETMPLYYKTGMSQANMSMDDLIQAVQAGDTPLQEILANGLARIGQMVRREKSFKGISVTTYTDSKNRARDENRGDRMTSVMRNIFKLDVAIAEAFARAVRRARGTGDKTGKTQTVWGIPVEGSQIAGDGFRISSTVDRANFAATAHNAVRQLLVSMKAEIAVEQAIEALQERSHIEQKPDGTYMIVNHDGRIVVGEKEGLTKEVANMSVAPKGRKPFIAIDNTMGSFVKFLKDERDLEIGGPFNIGYGQTLRKHLEKVLEVYVRDPMGNETKYIIDINHPQFPLDLREAFHAADEKLKTDIGDIPGSPIDYIKQGLIRAGYKVDEITGRDLVADFTDLERPILRERTGQEKSEKKEILKAYNVGGLDALIVNRSGAEGVSAHAHPDFFKQDPRPRILFGVQAQQNIDDEVQLMGRINRKGQVALPMYRMLFLDIPGELRPASVLMRKLKSLSANTSANSDSPLSQKSLPDMNNKYGNQVVRAWVVENPGIAADINVTPDDGFIRVSGRIAMQPTTIQREFFEECEQEYLNLIEEHKEQGTYDLEVQDIDFKAKVLEKQILVQGTDENHPFGGSTFLEKLDVVNPTKPYTMERLVEMVQERLGGKTAWEINEKALNDLHASVTEYINERSADLGAAFDPAKTRQDLDSVKTLIRNNPLEIGNEFQITLGDAFPVMRGVLLDIRYETKKGKGNPSALSRIRLVFAVNNSLRRVTIPLSKLARGAASVGYWDQGVPDNWDEISSKGIRSTRYVITGNLLQGFAQAPESSRIVRFTMEDGTMREAILTPMAYDPAQTATEVRVTAGQAFKAWEANNPLLSPDVEIHQGEITVSKSKGLGGKYFTDDVLRNLLAAKDFETRGDKMRGVISENANMERAIGRIYELGGGFSLDRTTFNKLFGQQPQTFLRAEEAGARYAPSKKGAAAQKMGKPLSEITVKVTAIREATGEKLKVDSNAQEALDDVNSRIKIGEAMLECLAS